MARRNRPKRVAPARAERPKSPEHVGHLVWKFLIKNRYQRVLLAKETNRSLVTVSRQLRKHSMQVAELFEFCHVLKHNFFDDLAAVLPPEYSSKSADASLKMATMEEQISDLLTANEALKQENKKLTERVDLLIKKL